MADAVEKNKGMWEGKSGLAAGSEVNAPDRDEIYTQLSAELTIAFELLRDTEMIIDNIGKLLNLSQPKMGIGKLGIRWWKRGSRFIEPVLVRWMMQTNKVMTPVLAHRVRTRKNGRFSTNFNERERLLEVLSDTLTKRAALKKRIESCRKSLHNLWKIRLTLDIHEVTIDQLKAEVLRNLVDEGYEIEDHYRTYLEEYEKR